ncbi:hypothetical protein [Actinomadura chibensis]|uniref:Uncharacterized protein n=1 Tax=Actinomadura chibensis TaxID=392828 RepID=A0A5D0NAM7_9ACTN|nr:hypothetical protein [Actinomadura chibensis]TYB41245.1 hypothetical protein FXF69_37770 [Actinomadura chibensis]
MRSRITGRTLLPVLAAAAVAVPAVPAAALAAPPPAPDAAAPSAAGPSAAGPSAGSAGPQTQSTSDCAKALQALTSLKLLPERPDLGRVICTSRAEKDAPPARDDAAGQVTSEHPAANGRTVREDTILGVPVEWPRSVTVHVPTVNDHWYTYTAKKG